MLNYLQNTYGQARHNCLSAAYCSVLERDNFKMNHLWNEGGNKTHTHTHTKTSISTAVGNFPLPPSALAVF